MALEHNTRSTLARERTGGVKEACRQLGLDEAEYGATFEQIAHNWEIQLGSFDYLKVFVTPDVLKLCKSPADFLRASQIVVEATKSVWKTGSHDFWCVLIQAVAEQKVTLLDDLKNLCDELVLRNSEFITSKDGRNIRNQTGAQFRRFWAEIGASSRN